MNEKQTELYKELNEICKKYNILYMDLKITYKMEPGAFRNQSQEAEISCDRFDKYNASVLETTTTIVT